MNLKNLRFYLLGQKMLVVKIQTMGVIITTNGAVPSFSYIINNVLDTLEGGSFNTNLDIDDYEFVDESSIVIQDLEIGLYQLILFLIKIIV